MLVCEIHASTGWIIPFNFLLKKSESLASGVSECFRFEFDSFQEQQCMLILIIAI